MMPPPQSATIAQAKRSYKDRGRPQLTEREQKQLMRAAELDRRARRTKEQEKRKIDAIKKRTEKEKRLKEAEGRAQIGSQRRHDRFGFASSQAHLGKWFGSNSKVSMQEVDAIKNKPEYAMDSFQDGLDDDDLIDVVSILEDKGQDLVPSLMSPPALPRSSACTLSKASTSICDSNELALFVSSLESSTQIARDIEEKAPLVQDDPQPKIKQVSLNTSFGSGDFDLSVEDIEALDATTMIEAKLELDKQIMPPPPIRARAHRNDHPLIVTGVRTMASPNRASSKALNASTKEPAKMPLPYDAGFTSTQLESFIDDDIQLTQVFPG